MTPGWVYTRQVYLARGKGVHLLWDIATPAPHNWAVAVTQENLITFSTTGLLHAQADEAFENYRLLCEVHTGWLAVRDRQRNNADDVVKWEGTPAQIAGVYFEIGTWGWVDTIRLLRNAEAKILGEQNEQ